MPRIVYLSYDGLTDPLGQSQILPYQIGLKHRGYDITIISFEKKENNNLKPIISEQLLEAKINWIPLNYSKSPPIFSTIYDLIRLKNRVHRLYNKEFFQIIHCRSYLTALIGLRLKRKKGVKFIFDMRGFWADERIDGGIWKLSNPIYRWIYNFFKKSEKQFLSESDHVISLTSAGKKIIESDIVPQNFAPIQIIPCCVDNEHFDPKKTNSSEMGMRKVLEINEDQFILGYVGSIGTWYMLPEMMDFFAVLITKIKGAIFLFVTKERASAIFSEATRAGVPKESIKIVSAARNEMPNYISIFDWSIFFIKPVFSKQASSPTKQGELMSMGIPIVCNLQIGDTDEIVRKYSCGIVVPKFSMEDYNAAVNELLSFNVQAEKIRNGSIDYFSLNNGIDCYDRVYESF